MILTPLNALTRNLILPLVKMTVMVFEMIKSYFLILSRFIQYKCSKSLQIPNQIMIII